MKLYGKTWTRAMLEARVGRLEQIGGVRRLQLTEGCESGSELIQVRTGAGLCYYVTPGRGMDISLAEFGGVPISWQSPNGDVHPAFFQPSGLEWLRSAAGGLLMTCGLTQVGSPGMDNGESLGLHGRIHHQPARQVAAQGQWHGDEYEISVSGMMEQTRIFGEYLRLSREIRSRLGENEIRIHDRVENIGSEPTPFMILYHFNFGFPLMSEDTRILFPSRRVVPRESETILAGYDQWQAPTAGYQERVYYHEDLAPAADQPDWTQAFIQNPHFPQADGKTVPLELTLSWSTQNLPRLIQWKMLGAGVYVLGIEPANCHVGGRVSERERGTLQTLAPGEAKNFELTGKVGIK